MRTLVIGDIHGGYKALLQVMERAEVTTNDTLIFLGDYVDGWSQSAELIEYLIQLKEHQQCVFVRGNHDLWCDLWLNKGATNPIWMAHGGIETTESYIRTGFLTCQKHKEFFTNMKNYHIDFQNRLFIHAGFTSMHGVKREEYESNYYFDRTLWEAALIAEKVSPENISEITEVSQRFHHYDEIYIGHTPTINYGEDIPMKAYNVWNIDTGAGFKGSLTIMDIDTKEYWQSDPLPELYPNEKGRN